MDKTSTLNDLSYFSNNEKNLLAELGFVVPIAPTPEISTIDNILNYSKVLSVRKSEMMGNIETILN